MHEVETSIVINVGEVEIEIRRAKSIHSREKQTKVEPHWDYSSSHGPTMWSRLFPELRWKRFQSPIRIETDQCVYQSELNRYSFVFQADDRCCQTLENTGHSFQVSGRGYSYITGGPVLDAYQFLQFHMHWGSHDLEGCEHVIDGERLPAELHVVTWNTNRYSTAHDAAQSGEFGALMVFAVLIRVVPDDNPVVSKLLDLFSRIVHRGEKITLDNKTVSLRHLLPESMKNYYTYDGSLTTPMCHESVRWVIFRDRLGLSRRQLDQLRQLKHTCRNEGSTDGHIHRNYRPLMPLNGRSVYRSFF